MAVVSLLPLKFFSSSADNIARKNREVRKKMVDFGLPQKNYKRERREVKI